jgi:PPM family protein phosphatase
MSGTESSLAERGATLTERGRRPVNQDAALAVSLPDGRELIAVADGMGGHAGGEIASRRAIDALQAALGSGAGLRDAFAQANAAVLEEARQRPEYAGMGTTLVALLRNGTEYFIANVGDSRAYRVDESGILQLTRDHSFIEDAVSSGQLTREEAAASRWRNALTRAVGLAPEVEVDCYGPFSAEEPHSVVLCTDGLYRAVANERIQAAISAAESPADVARHLAVAAHDAGSDDNISLAVARFGGRANAGVAAPGPTEPRKERRKRPRRRVPGHVRRWARVEVAAILLGLVAVILYIFILTQLL